MLLSTDHKNESDTPQKERVCLRGARCPVLLLGWIAKHRGGVPQGKLRVGGDEILFSAQKGERSAVIGERAAVLGDNDRQEERLANGAGASIEVLESFREILEEHPSTTEKEIKEKFDSGELTLDNTSDMAKAKEKTNATPTRKEARELVSPQIYLYDSMYLTNEKV